jgi:hypothetical protein
VLAVAAAVYAAWGVATYLLEGYPRTLLRPEATGLRAAYAAIANLGVGIIGGAWAARWLAGRAGGTAGRLGFRGAAHAVATAAAGGGLGLLLYRSQDPPALGPAALANTFAQVLVVSAAEVVVCWALVGGAVEWALRPWGWAAARAGGVGVAAAAFGVYHFAHSPPFNSPAVVAFLAGVGVLTGVFFLAARDVYGTIAFHNWLGVVGVARATEAAPPDPAGGQLQPALLCMAAAALVTLVLCHRAWLRGGRSNP